MPGASDKLNVLFLHAQSDFTADSTIHAHLIRHLDRARFRVHVACTRGEGSEPPPALRELQAIPEIQLRPTTFAPGFRERSVGTIVRSVGAALESPIEYAALARYIRSERIDIVHSVDRPRDSIYAVTLGKLSRAKSVVHVHVKWSEGYSAPAKWAVREADAVFGISEYVTDSVVKMGKARANVHTVLNSVDTSRWDVTLSGDVIRAEFGIAPDAPLLVSVSRLFPEKGQPELLRALALVRQQVPNVRLLIVGAETPFSPGFSEELRRLSRDLGLSSAVVFTGPRRDVPSIMAACDVFSLPSFEEPFGLVFLEAMAMHKPVIALDNGGTPEVVEHGRSGLLSKSGDIATLANNIVTLLQDRSLCARLADHGRARVLSYFNAQRMAADAAAAYEAVLRA